MLNSNNEALLKQVNKNQTLLIQKLQEDNELLNEEIEASNQQIDTLKSEHHISLSQQQSIIEDLRTECQNYQHQNMELQSKFTQSVLQNQLLQSKYDKKNKQYKDQIVELKQQIKLSHLKNQDYQRDILDLRKSLDNYKLEISKLIDNSTLLNEQNKQLKANLDLQQVDYENKIEQYQNLIQDKDEEITLIINENTVLNRNLEQMEINVNLSESLHSQIDTLQKDNQNLQIQLSDLQNHNSLLKQQLQLQSSEIQISSSSLQLQSAPQQRSQDLLNRNTQQEMVVLQKESDIQTLQQTIEVQNVQLTQSQSFNNDLQLSYQQEIQNTEKDNQNQINTLKQQIVKLTSELKECELKHIQVKQVQESTISKLNHDIRLLEQKNEDLILHNNKLINEIKQNELIQQKESTIICQKISEFEIQLLESHHQIEDLNQEKQKQELVVEKLNHQLQSSKQIQSKLEEDITKYQNFLISHHKQLEAVTSNESSDSSDSSEETITEKPQQLNFDALCSKLTEQIRLVQLRLEIYEKQIKQYKQELHSKTVEIQKLFSENSDSNLKVQRLSQLQPKLDNQEAILKQKDLTIEDLTQQIAKQQAQLHENENKLQQLEIENDVLNRKNVELSNFQNQIQIDHTIKNDFQISSIKEEQMQNIELMNSEQTPTSIFDQIFPNINYQILLFTEENTTQMKSLVSSKIDHLEKNLQRTINKYQKLQEIIQKNYHNIQNLYEQSQQTLVQKENLFQIENQKQQIQKQTLLEEVHQKSILISQLEDQQQILSLQLKNLNQQNQDQKHVITQLEELDEKMKINDKQKGSNQIKLEELQQKIISYEADLEKALQKNTQLDLLVKDLNNQVQSKLNTINELRQELDNQKNNQTGTQFDSSQLQNQQKQILELISNNTNLNQQNQDAQLRLREIEAQNQDLQDRLNQLSKQGVSQKETINQLQQQNQMEIKQNLTFLQQMDPLQKQIDHLTRENRKLQQSNNDFEKAYGKLTTYGSPRKVQNQDQNCIKKLEDEIQQMQYKYQQEIQEKNIELNNIQKQYEWQLEEVRELKLDEIQKLEQNCITLSNQLKQEQVVNNELMQKNSQFERDNSKLSEEIEKLIKQQNLQGQNQVILQQKESELNKLKLLYEQILEENQKLQNNVILFQEENKNIKQQQNQQCILQEKQNNDQMLGENQQTDNFKTIENQSLEQIINLEYKDTQINHECKYIELNQTIGNLQKIIDDQNLQLLYFKNHTLDLEEQIKQFEVQIQHLIQEKEQLCQIKDSNKSNETLTKSQQNEELASQNQFMEQEKNELLILDKINQDKLKFQQQQIEQGGSIHQYQQVIEYQQVEVNKLTIIESGCVEQKKEINLNRINLEVNQAEALLPVQQEQFQVELKQKQTQIEAKDIQIHELTQEHDKNLQLNKELEQQLKDKQTIIIGLENEIKQLNYVNQTQLQKIIELNQDFQSSLEQVQEQKQTLTNQSEQYALLESQYNDMQQNLIKVETENNSLIQINQQLESSLEQQQQVNVQIFQKQEQSFQLQLDKLNILLQDQKNQVKLLQQENGEQKQEIEKITNDQKQLEKNKLNELAQVKKESEGQIQTLMDQISNVNVQHQNEILEMDNVIKTLIQEKDKNRNNDMIEQLQIKIKMNEEQIERLLMTNKALIEENSHLQEQIKDDLNSSFCSNASQK